MGGNASSSPPAPQWDPSCNVKPPPRVSNPDGRESLPSLEPVSGDKSLEVNWTGVSVSVKHIMAIAANVTKENVGALGEEINKFKKNMDPIIRRRAQQRPRLPKNPQGAQPNARRPGGPGGPGGRKAPKASEENWMDNLPNMETLSAVANVVAGLAGVIFAAHRWWCLNQLAKEVTGLEEEFKTLQAEETLQWARDLLNGILTDIENKKDTSKASGVLTIVLAELTQLTTSMNAILNKVTNAKTRAESERTHAAQSAFTNAVAAVGTGGTMLSNVGASTAVHGMNAAGMAMHTAAVYIEIKNVGRCDEILSHCRRLEKVLEGHQATATELVKEIQRAQMEMLKNDNVTGDVVPPRLRGQA